MNAALRPLALAATLAAATALNATPPAPVAGKAKPTSTTNAAATAEAKTTAPEDDPTAAAPRTGSHLPPRVVLVGRVQFTAQPVRVITRHQLDGTSATDLAGALRRTVPGMR